MNILFVVLLAVIGVTLLVIEMFLLPGFGFAGVTGLLCLIGSVVAAYMLLGATAGHITLGAVLVALAVSIIVFLKSKAIEKMSLDTKIDSSVRLANPGKKIEQLKENK